LKYFKKATWKIKKDTYNKVRPYLNSVLIFIIFTINHFGKVIKESFVLKKRVKYIHDLCGTNCYAAVVFRAFSKVEGDDRK